VEVAHHREPREVKPFVRDATARAQSIPRVVVAAMPEDATTDALDARPLALFVGEPNARAREVLAALVPSSSSPSPPDASDDADDADGIRRVRPDDHDAMDARHEVLRRGHRRERLRDRIGVVVVLLREPRL
jgi:hypothetical protein